MKTRKKSTLKKSARYFTKLNGNEKLKIKGGGEPIQKDEEIG